MIPKSYQEKSIAHLIHVVNKHGAAADASDTGTGKTLVAIEVLKALGDPATLVVCPLAVRPTWHRTAKEQGIDLDTINYEMVRLGRTQYGEWRVPLGYRKERFYWDTSQIKFIIFDEAHRAKGMKTDNGELVKACRRQNIPALALSATFADTPLELFPIGYLLRLHDGDERATLKHPDPLNFVTWARRYGCGKGHFSFLEFKGNDAEQAKQMLKLNKVIFPEHGSRVRISELGDEFPDQQVTAELLALGNPSEVNALYDEMAEELTALNDRDLMMEALRLERAQAAGFQGTELPPDPLVRAIRARQKVELLKVPGIVEATLDDLAQGLSVVLFVNFRQTLEALSARFRDCRVIHGDQSPAEREINRGLFQDDVCRVLVAIHECAGLGLDLHDIRGQYSRMTRIFPGFNAKLLRQEFGRTRRIGGKSKSLVRIMLASSTCEEDVYKNIKAKLTNLDSLQDGDLLPNSLKIALTATLENPTLE